MSCNVAFGWLGLQPGPEEAGASRPSDYGFGQQLFRPSSTTTSPSRRSASSRPARWSRARPRTSPSRSSPTAAIGQYEVQATPLQMAMVVAGVANSGRRDEAPTSSTRCSRPTSPCSTRPAPKTLDERRDQPEPAPSEADRHDGLGGRPGHRHRRPDPGRSRSPARPAPPRARPEPTAVRLVRVLRARPTTRRLPSRCWSRTRASQRDQISGNGLAAPIARDVMEAVINSDEQVRVERAASPPAAWGRCGGPRTPSSAVRSRSRCSSPSSPTTPRFRQRFANGGAQRRLAAPPAHRHRLRLRGERR